jgi:hypothetical protein
VNVKFKKVLQSRLMLGAGPDLFETCGHAPELTSRSPFRVSLLICQRRSLRLCKLESHTEQHLAKTKIVMEAFELLRKRDLGELAHP